MRYAQELADCQAVASVGSQGDSYDNALAKALNSLYKAELIRNRGPWRNLDDVEYATAEWVHWFNTTRPHTALNGATPTEHEHAYQATNPAPEPTTHTPQLTN